MHGNQEHLENHVIMSECSVITLKRKKKAMFLIPSIASKKQNISPRRKMSSSRDMSRGGFYPFILVEAHAIQEDEVRKRMQYLVISESGSRPRW